MFELFTGRKATILDGIVRVYRDSDINSAIICELAKGEQVQLGCASEIDGRIWLKAQVTNETVGFVLGASIRSHSDVGKVELRAKLQDSKLLPIEVPNL